MDQDCDQKENNAQQHMEYLSTELAKMKEFNDLVQNFNHQLIEQVNNIHNRVLQTQSFQGSRQMLVGQPQPGSLQQMPTLTSGMSIGGYAAGDNGRIRSVGQLSGFNNTQGLVMAKSNETMNQQETTTTLNAKIVDHAFAAPQMVIDENGGPGGPRHQSQFTFYDGQAQEGSQSNQRFDPVQSEQLSRNMELLNRLKILEESLGQSNYGEEEVQEEMITPTDQVVSDERFEC
jgi:hypothetical protein